MSKEEEKKHPFNKYSSGISSFAWGLLYRWISLTPIHRDTYISPPGSAWSFIYSLITGATARLMTLFKTFFGNKKTNDWALDMCPSIFFSKLS